MQLVRTEDLRRRRLVQGRDQYLGGCRLLLGGGSATFDADKGGASLNDTGWMATSAASSDLIGERLTYCVGEMRQIAVGRSSSRTFAPA